MIHCLNTLYKNLCHLFCTEVGVCCVKKNNSPPSGVTCAKPHVSKPRPNLMAVSTSPRNASFTQSIWNYLVITSEVIH